MVCVIPPFFHLYAPLLEEFYELHWEFLCDLTIEMTIALARELGVHRTSFLRASTLSARGTKTERLLSLLRSVGGTHYITGPAARAYLDEKMLTHAGITVEYMSYDYPEYTQLYPPFVGEVSILDLLLMKGPKASDYIWKTPVSELSPTRQALRLAPTPEVGP